MTNIEMFTGKGGVGKTTMSVATALHHANHGKTLLISTDPTGSLSTIFSQRVDQEVCTVATNLDAVELTRDMILALWREKFAEEIYTVLSSFLPVGRDIIDYIEGAPGVEEEFMLDYLLTMADSGAYEMIVWDTAPTITTLNMLFIQELFYSHLTQAQRIYLKVKKVFHKVDPLKLIDQWRSLTLGIIDLLQTRTRCWVVANPERLPVEQACNVVDSLNKFGIGVNGYIMNKVLPEELCAGHPFLQEKFTAQQKYKEELRQAAKDYAYKEIPELTGEMSVSGMLGEVARHLHEPATQE
jgi:arsenite-transporting ATPase